MEKMTCNSIGNAMQNAKFLTKKERLFKFSSIAGIVVGNMWFKTEDKSRGRIHYVEIKKY